MPRCLVLLVLFGVANAIGAAERDANIARCAAIEDDAARLACFDRLAKPEPRIVTETITPESPSASADSRAQPPSQADRGEQASAPSAEEPLADRGLRRFIPRLLRRDRDKKDQGEAPEPEKTERVTVVGEITQVTELARGNFQVTLDNGQVWRENEYEVHTTYAVGDRVSISPGFLRSHDLRNERTRQSAKARRVK